MEREDILETTLGDLIDALSEETSRYVPDEKAANLLVAYLLSDLFRKSATYPMRWQ